MAETPNVPTQPSQQRFSCPSCGKRFVWQDSYAGRKVNCKCGAVFVAQLGGTVLVDQPIRMTDADEIQPTAPRTTPGQKSAAKSPSSSQPGVRVPAGYAFPRTRRAAHEMASDDEDDSPLRDRYVPVALIVIGAIGRAIQTFQFTSSHSLTAGHAIGLLVCELIIWSAAMFGGVLLAAQILGTSFGSPGQAALKLTAIALSVTAACYLLASIDREPGGPRGAVLAWHLLLIACFILFVYFFKLELSEGMLLVVIVVLIRLILLFAVSRGITPDAGRWVFFGVN